MTFQEHDCLHPGFLPRDEVAGVMQINAVIPAGVTGNAAPVSVQIGTVSTQNGVTRVVQQGEF
jgi:uncharacterized protein (TIGR03437 family)